MYLNVYLVVKRKWNDTLLNVWWTWKSNQYKTVMLCGSVEDEKSNRYVSNKLPLSDIRGDRASYIAACEAAGCIEH
jgi:hypothetical protein